MHRSIHILLACLLVFGLTISAVSAQDGNTPAEDGPRTVLDFQGNEVTIDAPPQRIVGMSASISEQLFAIGVMPVGVTSGMDYPSEALELPTFGTGYQPNLEKLAALEPDLIIANGQLNMPFIDKLQAIAPTLAIITLTTADIPANMRTLGHVTWNDEVAEEAAQEIEDFLDTMIETAAEQEAGPTILIVVGTLDVPNYGKSDTYLGDMAALLGATNIADGRDDQGPFPGYTQLSMEHILDQDPDFVFTITRGSDTPMPEDMATDPIWSSLTAYENDQVIELDNRLFVEAPGPRVVEAMQWLYIMLYGEE